MLVTAIPGPLPRVNGVLAPPGAYHGAATGAWAVSRHVRLAGRPGRCEPGEAAAGALFSALSSDGYDGDAGLEYVPIRPPASSPRAVTAHPRLRPTRERIP